MLLSSCQSQGGCVQPAIFSAFYYPTDDQATGPKQVEGQQTCGCFPSPFDRVWGLTCTGLLWLALDPPVSFVPVCGFAPGCVGLTLQALRNTGLLHFYKTFPFPPLFEAHKALPSFILEGQTDLHEQHKGQTRGLAFGGGIDRSHFSSSRDVSTLKFLRTVTLGVGRCVDQKELYRSTP